MWVVLAVIAFGAGQVYLFRCLRNIDRLLEQQSAEELPEKEILSIAFSDPAAADHMTELLEGFSRYYPELEIVLRTGPDVTDAVYDGRAAVGFLPAGQPTPYGLKRQILNRSAADAGARQEDVPAQEILWKPGAVSSPAGAFVRYLRDSGAFDGGNGESFVV